MTPMYPTVLFDLLVDRPGGLPHRDRQPYNTKQDHGSPEEGSRWQEAARYGVCSELVLGEG